MIHNMRQARYERACWWLAQDVHLVPLKLHSKELHSGYGSRLAHISEVDFARKWFLNTDANLGVVLGEPTGLIVGDWDKERDYESWRHAAGMMVNTLTERTSRGYHVFFIGRGLISAASNGCELKTRGVCMVSPSVHPSGTVYQVVNDAPIAAIDSQIACQLFPFLSEVQRELEHNVRADSPGEGLSGACRALGSSIIARIKAARSITDEMSAAGIKFQYGGRTTLVAICPFHQDHSPSLWANPGTGLWGCNRPDCPAAGIHDVINFRALHRGISNQAAIKQLAAEFLGSESTAAR